MHLLGSALLRGGLHHSQFQAKWLWDCTCGLYRLLGGPLEISCETLYPSAFTEKPWISTEAPRLCCPALTLVLWWPERRPGMKSTPLRNLWQNASPVSSSQRNLCSGFESKDHQQQLLKIYEERRERRPKEKWNYSWETVWTTIFIQLCQHCCIEILKGRDQFLFYTCVINKHASFFMIHFIKGKWHLSLI